jgi:hypothetical protein
MLTTAGSTRRAISAKEAESASGAFAICAALGGCGSSSATTSIKSVIAAPMPTPTKRHAAARAAIHTRSLRRMARSASVV